MPNDTTYPLTPEQEALRARARELADGRFAERAARWDASEEYPWDNVKDLAAAGFMGMTIPAAHGGGERPLLDVVLVIEEIARACGISGRIVVEGELHFENCQIPRENLLVGPGDGFKKLMSAYNGQRLGAATVALGIAQGAYERALGYAAERKQFGRAIGEFQGIRWKLADMAIKLDAARLLIHRAAVRAGRGFPDALDAAKAKTFAAETAQEITSQALQIHGAAGYGRSLPLERMMRDARMFAIGGGTLEMMRNLIADHILPTRSNWRA